MDTRTISTVTAWTPQGSKEATEIRLRNFSEYNFDGTGGRVYWQLLSVSTETITPDPESEDPGEESVSVIKTPVQDGYLPIPNSVVQQWGEDDDIIFNYVCTTLGLVQVPVL
jgi:hypothetical protein